MEEGRSGLTHTGLLMFRTWIFDGSCWLLEHDTPRQVYDSIDALNSNMILNDIQYGFALPPKALLHPRITASRESTPHINDSPLS
jgi:hypothetical protein